METSKIGVWRANKYETEPGLYKIPPNELPEADFDTEEEASNYCNLIDPELVWVIAPIE